MIFSDKIRLDFVIKNIISNNTKHKNKNNMKKFLKIWALLVLSCMFFGVGLYFLVICFSMKCSPFCVNHGLYLIVFVGSAVYIDTIVKKRLKTIKITKRELRITAASAAITIPVVFWAFGPIREVVVEKPEIIKIVLGFSALILLFFSFYYFTKFLGRMGKK